VTADAGLVFSRFVHFTALLFAFGICFFPLYAFSGSEAAARWNMRSRFKASFLTACFVALISGVFWLVFTAASMAGSLAEVNSNTLASVLGESAFGRVWTIHLALIIVLCFLAAADLWGRPRSAYLIVALSAACLTSLAGVGHTQEEEGAALLMRAAADGAHLLAAGAWLGGLVALLAVLPSKAGSADRSKSDVGHVLMRFSGMGYCAVAILLGTGLINSWFQVPNLSQLTSALYGQLLILKLGLFGLMLVLAVVNRFWLVPALAGSGARNLLRLRNHIISEQVLGVFIIALVSVIGTLAPFGEQ
jgi:putative copper resistance protein D